LIGSQRFAVIIHHRERTGATLPPAMSGLRRDFGRDIQTPAQDIPISPR
jgi:hypothetical protein